ncbi:MAG TPA: hypothetical protein VI199_14035 [Novosphingobium sp.]
MLILPSATVVRISGLPDLDKVAMISIGTGLGAWLMARPVPLGNRSKIFAVLCAVFLTSPFVTASLNGDPIVGSGFYLKGMVPYDAVSQMAVKLFVVLPFWAGRRLLGDEEGHRALVIGLLVAMLIYSLPILLEIRISPQLHTWVYGFFQHSFIQQMRAGGFRAVVFLPHGLVVALFLGLAFLAAAVAKRQGARILGAPSTLVLLYLGMVLILQKSWAATAVAFLLGIVILALRPRKQVSLAALIALVVITYPMLRNSHLIPVEAVTSYSGSLSADRSQSFAFRIQNEEILLKKSQERPWFGWGSWGRNRVYDLETGRDISVTDGTWIIVIGSWGWVGYLAQFGLLSLPIFMLRRAGRRIGGRIPPFSAGLALMLAMNLFDLIPNSSLTPVTWLMAGALSGGLAIGRKQVRSDGAATPDGTELAGDPPAPAAEPGTAAHPGAGVPA